MNKEYILKDGKALIIDDVSNDKVIDYYDNLDKVLVKENLIEIIEKKLQKNKMQLEENTKNICVEKLLALFLSIVAIILGILFNGLFSSIAVIIGVNIFGIILDVFYKKTQNGIEAQIKYLTKELAKEKDYVEELKKDLTVTKNTDELKRTKVDDKEALEALRERIIKYFAIGWKYRKFNKYYQNGELEEIVDKEDIELVKEFLEEKGPILSKRKKN